MNDDDKKFYQRADAHIKSANEQLSEANNPAEISGAMMYGTARFNAWLSASGWDNAEEMKKAKAETMSYFLNQYQEMLEHNIDDYIENFDSYMDPKK